MGVNRILIIVIFSFLVKTRNIFFVVKEIVCELSCTEINSQLRRILN